MPRGWAVNRSLPNNTLEAKEAREALIHTIGNHTLVTKSLNSTLSNDPWLKKRKTLRGPTVLLLNSDLHDDEEWNEEKIMLRGKEVYKLARKIWPWPS
jgi:hypothetical protein